jgi:L-alanine-DL-glutamate epimerase-like enolase superfamily enzyme
MRITDLTLTLFAGPGIPPTRYGPQTGRFHMNLEIHHGGNSLNNVANLHVTMAIRNCEFFEVLLPAAAQQYGLAEDIEVDREGLAHAPDAPGLGARIDFDLIRRRTVAVLR